MDAYQQPHRYMRPPPPPPPPPSTADPYYHHQQQQQQQQQQPSQRAPPVPQQGPWYSNQFQYHPPSSHSPSPPPPPPQQQSQWAPQPPPPHHSDHSAYPPPPLPYPAHPHPNNNNHFPPPPPPTPPPPPPPPSHVPHSQIPQAYPNQEWANPNWSHHQGWDYSGHNNVEDWAARAREWAAAKAAMDDQHPPPQSQFTPVGRSEEQSRFHDQYPQAVNSHYPASSYQQYPPPHRPPMVFPQETAASVGSGPHSYVPDGHLPYTVLVGETNTGFSHQETFPTSPYVHQQEVPSSYSSVTGKEETAEKEQMYTSFPFSTSAQDVQYHVQPSQPAVGRSVLSEQPFAYGNQAADPTTDLSDQPLDFAPRFNRDHDPHMQSSYAAHHDPAGTVRGIDPVAALPSINSWTPPAAPGVIYPPISAVPPSGPQHDPSLVVPPVSGHAVPPFGRFPGPSFQPTIPSAGAPYGLGAGPTVHPTTAFPGDTYGVSTVSERPKKAAMPNWLKEEIIKNKAIISKSSLEHPKEETQSIEDDGVDKSIGKGDQADSKSIDSSRSTEEEDDDEDYVEAARNAAINQEIKRVLTEVLLKVTDELFDEIATKVLSEDDLTVEVDHNIVSSSHNASAVPTSKASAKVLVPVKAKESETGGVSEKSSSSSPGDVLGLANYASDEDGDGEIQSSSMQNSREIVVPQQSSIKKLPEDMHDATENGRSQVELEEHSRGQTNLESDGDQSDDINVGGKMLDGDNGLGSKDTLGEKVILKTELPGENVSVKSTMDDSQGQDTRVKSDKNDQHENRRSSSGKDFVKEVESSRKRADEKGDENRRRQDERHLRKEKTDDRNGSKERMKVQGLKPGEQVNESESRRRSTHLDVKEDRKDTERHQRASGKEDTDRKRERAKDREEDRSRHKLTSDSSKHKRRRSPSISSRDRNSKDNSVSHANDSSDEASDDSKRKLRSRKRNLSPSPLRSRRRQVSRSPHSKHSQRRHSPYSSLETTRGKRSRSRSPVRRQR